MRDEEREERYAREDTEMNEKYAKLYKEIDEESAVESLSDSSIDSVLQDSKKK